MQMYKVCKTICSAHLLLSLFNFFGMIYLILSVITSTLLVVILKLFNKFSIDTFQAIVVNYWVCTFTGGCIEHYFTFSNFTNAASHQWLALAAVLGIFFIVLFNLMGWTAQTLGLTAVSVANKLSLVIPVSIAFIFFHEKITPLKVLAILMALASVVMVTFQKSDKQHKISPIYFLLPVILFLGSGFNDSLVNHAQKNLLTDVDKAPFVIWIFQIAALLGTLVLIILLLMKKKKWNWKNVLGGICLGIPNYFSMYYLVKALSDSGLQSTEIFPINNVAIVICASFSGIIFFKEKISRLQIAGIILACISILLLI